MTTQLHHVAPYHSLPHPPLPPERPVHQDDVVRGLDNKLRRCAEEGWKAGPAFNTPTELAIMISYNARLIGANLVSRIAATQLVPGIAQHLGPNALIAAAAMGASRAKQAAEDAVPVEVMHVAVRRAQYPGATWTGVVYLRATTARGDVAETKYACALLLDGDEPSGQLLNLLDVFGHDVLDVAKKEHVLELRERLPGFRARAITDDVGLATRLLRADGYPP